MIRRTLALVITTAVLLAAAGPARFGGPATALAQPQLPGMCNGRSDPNVAVNAYTQGSGSTPDYSLFLKSDSQSRITGKLEVDYGRGSLIVSYWCRMWTHVPGEPFGNCEDAQDDPGTVNLHAVGLSWYNGTLVLVRTDVRQNNEGLFYRVRFKPVADSEEGCGDSGGCTDSVSALADDGCEDDGWTKIPTEGWSSLDVLRVCASDPTCSVGVPPRPDSGWWWSKR